ERAGIEQRNEPLAGKELSLLTLTLDGLVGAGVLGLVTQPLQLVELRLRRVLVRRRHLQRVTPQRSGSCVSTGRFRRTATEGHRPDDAAASGGSASSVRNENARDRRHGSCRPADRAAGGRRAQSTRRRGARGG